MEHPFLGNHHFLDRFQVLFIHKQCSKNILKHSPGAQLQQTPRLSLRIHSTASSKHHSSTMAFLSTLTSLCASAFLKQSNSGSAQRAVSSDICDSSTHPVLKEEKNEWMGMCGCLHTRGRTEHPCWAGATPTDHPKQMKSHGAIQLTECQFHQEWH